MLANIYLVIMFIVEIPYAQSSMMSFMTYVGDSPKGLPSVEHYQMIENTQISELRGEENALSSLFNNLVYINVLDVVNISML